VLCIFDTTLNFAQDSSVARSVLDDSRFIGSFFPRTDGFRSTRTCVRAAFPHTARFDRVQRSHAAGTNRRTLRSGCSVSLTPKYKYEHHARKREPIFSSGSVNAYPVRLGARFCATTMRSFRSR